MTLPMYVLPWLLFFTVVGLMQQIYEAAAKQKSWDSFTKAQRKTIMQWKEHATVREKEREREERD